MKRKTKSQVKKKKQHKKHKDTETYTGNQRNPTKYKNGHFNI